MQLVHLSLTNFRNFIRLEMEFPPGPTLVVGPNAQGKTSLLEAIDYLGGAEPPRAGGERGRAPGPGGSGRPLDRRLFPPGGLGLKRGTASRAAPLARPNPRPGRSRLR